jgi:hypothetical protein
MDQSASRRVCYGIGPAAPFPASWAEVELATCNALCGKAVLRQLCSSRVPRPPFRESIREGTEAYQEGSLYRLAPSPWVAAGPPQEVEKEVARSRPTALTPTRGSRASAMACQSFSGFTGDDSRVVQKENCRPMFSLPCFRPPSCVLSRSAEMFALLHLRPPSSPMTPPCTCSFST